jgi:hypothetical protein
MNTMSKSLTGENVSAGKGERKQQVWVWHPGNECMLPDRKVLCIWPEHAAMLRHWLKRLRRTWMDMSPMTAAVSHLHFPQRILLTAEETPERHTSNAGLAQ